MTKSYFWFVLFCFVLLCLALRLALIINSDYKTVGSHADIFPESERDSLKNILNIELEKK